MSALGHDWPRPDSTDWRTLAACKTRTGPTERKRREDDEIAYALWALAWRIHAAVYGDSPIAAPQTTPTPSTEENR